MLKESTVFLSRMRELTLRLIDDNKRLDSENKSLKEQLKRLPLPLDLAQQQHQQQQQAFALSGLPTHMTQPMYSTAPMMATLPAAPYYAQAQVVQQQLDVCRFPSPPPSDLGTALTSADPFSGNDLAAEVE